MRKLILIAIAVLVLGTAAVAASIYWTNQADVQETVRALKKAVVKDFHDPESARFRSLRLQSDEGSILERIRMIDVKFLWESTPTEVLSVFRYDPRGLHLCGEVNAKNAFGAYVGYKPFWITGGKDPVPFIATRENDDFPKKMCDISKDLVIYTESDPS